jgi:predicted metal-dependent peptidase
VAIAVDTSGSMGAAELTAALREANGVLSAIGADITYLACDADVHELIKVRDVKEMAKRLTGGGGTDFRPVFEALEKVRPIPEVLIFITDGCGPAPPAPPPRTRVIWLLVGPYQQAPCSWGTQISIDGGAHR